MTLPPETFERTLSAAVGALLTTLTVTPLDVVKVRMQAQHPLTPEYIFNNHLFDDVEACSPSPSKTTFKLSPPRFRINGTLDGIFKITRYEGIYSLYRGFTPSLLMSMPATVVYFVGYERIKEHLTLHNYSSPILVPLIAGSSARIMAVTVVSPLELLRTKMQFYGRKDGGIGKVAKEIFKSVRSEGLRVLWRGLVPTLWRDVPFSAIYWASLEYLRSRMTGYNGGTDHEQTNPFQSKLTVNLISGALSGALAATITTPFDVAKTRRQVLLSQSSSSNSISHPKSMLRMLRKIWEEEGVSGLTRGLVPRVGKVAPACAIMITSYELGKVYFSGLAVKN